jgi:anaerobic ribonucleoside-triphosphate reductase activating protein
MDISNGKGIGVSLFTQGCPYRCKNCFNQITWDYEGGKAWDQEKEDKILSLLAPNYVSRLSILGGEPLITQNKSDLLSLVKRVKQEYPNKKIWIYTGGTYEEIQNKYTDILSYVDVLVDGRYVDELRDLKLKFRGSSNQRVIDLNKTREKGEVVIVEEVD